MSKTKFITNSNPMFYLLNRWLIKGNATKWIIILREYDLDFVTPKSKMLWCWIRLSWIYLRTHNCVPYLNHDNHCHIYHQAPHYLFINVSLTPFCDDASLMMRLIRSWMTAIVKLVVDIFLGWIPSKNSSMLLIFYRCSYFIALQQSNIIIVANSSPPKKELLLHHYI